MRPLLLARAWVLAQRAMTGELDDRARAALDGDWETATERERMRARRTVREQLMADLGTPDDLMEEFYAISVERRITHPAVAAITATARGKLFAARAG